MILDSFCTCEILMISAVANSGVWIYFYNFQIFLICIISISISIRSFSDQNDLTVRVLACPELLCLILTKLIQMLQSSRANNPYELQSTVYFDYFAHNACYQMSLRAKAAALFGASLKVMAFASPTFERTFWDTYMTTSLG